jgi:hypothetical protein
MPKQYAKEQLQILAADAEFNRRIAADEELQRLYDPSGDGLDMAEESARCLGSGRVICGVSVPPPTLGHLHTLSSIESPFAKSVRTFDHVLHDLAEALFVLHFGARAVAPVCDVFRWRRRVEQLRKDLGDNPALIGALLDAQRKAESELAAWRRGVMVFAETHLRIGEGETVEDAVKAVDDWIVAALSGLDMLPAVRGKDDKKKATSSRRSWKQALSDWRRGRAQA